MAGLLLPPPRGRGAGPARRSSPASRRRASRGGCPGFPPSRALSQVSPKILLFGEIRPFLTPARSGCASRPASISPSRFGIIPPGPGGSHGRDPLRGEGRTLPKAHRSAGGLVRTGRLAWVAAGGQRCHRGVTSGGCRGRGAAPRPLSFLLRTRPREGAEGWQPPG